MDYSIEEMFEMPLYSNVVNEEKEENHEEIRHDNDYYSLDELINGKCDDLEKFSRSNPFRQ